MSSKAQASPKRGKRKIKGQARPQQDKLTRKQAAFCAEYLIDLNAAQAAIRAGYSEATAKEIGCENLTKPNIQAEVQRLMEERSKRVEVSADRVLQELKAMAFYDPADLGSAKINGPADIANLPEEVRRAIVGWSWDRNGNFTVKLAGKTQQLEMIGRHLKMFTDKTEHTGADGSPLVPSGTSLSPEQIEQVERIRQLREQSAEKRS